MHRIPIPWIRSAWILPFPGPTACPNHGQKQADPHPQQRTPTLFPAVGPALPPRGSQRRRTAADPSDVLVSAVISTYLLTHLHHVLQRAEFGAQQEGREALAANYAQLRKVLCLDARSMEDASASGTEDDGQVSAA